MTSSQTTSAAAGLTKAFDMANMDAVSAITDAEFLIDVPVTFSNETCDERVLLPMIFDMPMVSKKSVKTKRFHPWIFHRKIS
jgi:hypothetical protein